MAGVLQRYRGHPVSHLDDKAYHSWANLRRKNTGRHEPHGVKYWGLGNESEYSVERTDSSVGSVASRQHARGRLCGKGAHLGARIEAGGPNHQAGLLR